MVGRLIARSISQPVWERWQKAPLTGEVFAVFERACDLLDSDGGFVVVVLPEIGNGPLNIVVDAHAGVFAAIQPGTTARLQGSSLWVGRVEVVLSDATIWDPRPDWDKFRNRIATIREQLPRLQRIAVQKSPERSLLALLSPAQPAGTGEDCSRTSRRLLTIAREAAHRLQVGWKGDVAHLRAGAASLAGLGGGLTPAGDDFLAGAMLWAWLAHPKPEVFCDAVTRETQGRTTTLSGALLARAGHGECSGAWHRLLADLASGSQDRLVSAACDVLSCGSTSGADTLAGFLHLSQTL